MFLPGKNNRAACYLLCVAVAGTAIVDCVKSMLTEQRIEATVLAYFLPLLLCLFVE